MHSCGMYNYSGQFAFKVINMMTTKTMMTMMTMMLMFRLVSLKMFTVQVGLPAKSGVSGSLVLVVPGVMGVTINSHHT